MAEESGTSNIKVLCRFRPINDKEKEEFPDQLCVGFVQDNQTIIINSQSEHKDDLQFKFDYVFTPFDTQSHVFEIAAKPTVDAVMQGFNGTIFAYGQTSSGKTWTMTGGKLEEDIGIIPRMVSTIFDKIQSSYSKIEFQVKVSYSEIYMERIRDLLNPTRNNLKIHEEKTRGVYIAELTEQYVTSQKEVFELMKIGLNNREIGFTEMNAGSSRSHSIFSLTITQTNLFDYSAKTGKLYLVDLAGSEKVSKTQAAGKRLEEAKNINKSLTMLGLVIAALTDPKAGHIPYRDSKLTRILQDSLGGNSKTTLIVTCSPSPFNESETISTCRFGIRAKSITNKPKVNREYTIAELKLMLSRAKEDLGKKNRVIVALEKALGKPASSLNVDAEEDEENECNDTKITGAYDDVINELEDIRTKLEQEIQKNSKLQEINNRLIEENQEIRNDHEFIHKQIVTLQTRLISTESILREKDDTIEKLTISNEALKADLSGENIRKLNTELELMKIDLESSKLKSKEATKFLEEENKQLKDNLSDEQTKNSKLLTDLETMEMNMQNILSKNPNVDKEALKIINESHESLKNRWRDEKKTMIKEVHVRIQKIKELQSALQDSSNRFRVLENSLSEGEKANKTRSDGLQRTLEQLTLMYHQLMSKESNAKVEKKISDKKIERISQKLLDLEKESRENKGVIEKLKYENDKMQAELKELREMKNLQFQDSFLSPCNQRKTIRGGQVVEFTEVVRKSIAFFPDDD